MNDKIFALRPEKSPLDVRAMDADRFVALMQQLGVQQREPTSCTQWLLEERFGVEPNRTVCVLRLDDRHIELGSAQCLDLATALCEHAVALANMNNHGSEFSDALLAMMHKMLTGAAYRSLVRAVENEAAETLDQMVRAAVAAKAERIPKTYGKRDHDD